MAKKKYISLQSKEVGALEKRTRMWKKVCRKTAIISSLLIVLSISVAKAQEIKGQEMTSEISDETKGIDVEF